MLNILSNIILSKALRVSYKEVQRINEKCLSSTYIVLTVKYGEHLKGKKERNLALTVLEKIQPKMIQSGKSALCAAAEQKIP